MGGGVDGTERTRGNGGDAAASGGHRTGAARLVHEPALDGLRGLAVLAVLVFHLDRLQGGFLGVDLFFALSGYLITSLLLVERRTRGGIALGAFWVRRARRLLPALIVMLAGVAVLLATLTDAADRPHYRGDALATLGYVANWERMAAPVSYWDIFRQPSPLDHTWSLAIEEQFYLVWPLVALVVLGGWRLRRWPVPARVGGPVAGTDAGNGAGSFDGTDGRSAGADRGARRLGLLALAGGLASLVALGLLWSPVDTNRAYFGTDARLGPTLLGAAVATVTARRGRRAGPPSWALDAVAAIALAGMAAAMLVVDGQGAAYYRGGLAAFTVAALVVMVAVTGGPPGRVGRALSWSPLAALGVISYGVYLWHWPVIVYLTPERLGVRRSVAQAVCVIVTLALAVGSYRLVERPIRRGALSGRRAIGVAAASVAVVLVAVVVTTRGPLSESTASGQASVPGAGNRRYEFEPQDVAPGATRLLLVGDSGPAFLGVELADESARTGDRFAIGLSSVLDCPPARISAEVRFPGDRVVERSLCPDERRERWDRLARSMRADVVVIYIANAGGVAEQWVDDDWRTDCDATFDAAMERELGRDVDALAATGATVVLATSPDTGNFTVTSRDETACRNDTYRRVVAGHRGTLMIDLHGFLAEVELPPGQALLKDFVHLSEPAAERVAEWMLPAVERALAEGPAAAGPAR